MNDSELRVPYGVMWRILQISVHRYGSIPTGQFLVVMTHTVLDRVGYDPTVGELAEIAGLPKSSVSRYVAAELNAGFLEEYIDTEDRRRRKLRPTKKALTERLWHAEQLELIIEMQKRATSGGTIDAETLIGYMKSSTDALKRG